MKYFMTFFLVSILLGASGFDFNLVGTGNDILDQCPDCALDQVYFTEEETFRWIFIQPDCDTFIYYTSEPYLTLFTRS